MVFEENLPAFIAVSEKDSIPINSINFPSRHFTDVPSKQYLFRLNARSFCHHEPIDNPFVAHLSIRLV